MLSDNILLIHVFDADEIRVFMTQVIRIDYEDLAGDHPCLLDIPGDRERIVALMRFRNGMTASR